MNDRVSRFGIGNYQLVLRRFRLLQDKPTTELTFNQAHKILKRKMDRMQNDSLSCEVPS